MPIYPKPRRQLAGPAGLLIQRAAGRSILWLHAAWHLRRLEVLIVPGMGVLDDFTCNPLGWPLDILSWCLLGRLMGVKVIFVSVGAGPIKHPISRWLMRTAARAAHYRSYRDRLSKTFMEGIGLDVRNDPIYPDIAFRLPAPAVTRRRGGEGGPLTIGIGVMAYHGWRFDPTGSTRIYMTYIEKMTGFVVWLLEEGHVVRLLMGDEADRRAVVDLSRAVRSRRPDHALGSILFAPARTLHEVMEQMSDADIVVATRYHNVVCALKMSNPTISIGYAEKNDVLMKEVGLEYYCQSIDHLDIERLKTQTLRLITELDAVNPEINQVISSFERSLCRQEDVLASLIFRDPGRSRSSLKV